MITSTFEKKENIEDAAYVFFSIEMDVDSENLQQDEPFYLQEIDPETLLIMKDDFMHSLSRECLIVAETIMNLPEEMFLINGKLKKTALRKLLKKKTGWSVSKIEMVKDHLAQQLLDISYPNL